MSHSKKLFVCLLAVAVLIPLLANATVTRVTGLGGSGVNYIVKDQFNTAVWPQLIRNYGKVANAEFDNNAGWRLSSVSANYDFGESKSVLGFQLDRNQVNKYTEMPDAIGDGNGINNALTLRYGRHLGETMLIGAAITYASEGFTRDSTNGAAGPEIDMSASDMGLDVGLSDTETGWDLVAGFDIAGFTNEVRGTKVSEANGMMGVHVDGRWWWDYSETAALVPNIRFNMLSDGSSMPVTGQADAERTHKTTNINIGAGHNWWPADNALVIFDFGISLNGTAHEYKPQPAAPAPSIDSTTAWVYLPYWRVGAETKIFSWLDGRVGAERFWSSMTPNGDRPDEMVTSRILTNTYLGATAHWNRMSLDMIVNPNFMANGPDFIAGNGTGGNLFLQTSLKYDFNK